MTMTPFEDLPIELPSRSARKRQIEAQRQIVLRLAGMNARELARLSLPDELAKAVADLQKLKQGSARSRQLRFVTSLVAEIDDPTLLDRMALVHHR